MRSYSFVLTPGAYQDVVSVLRELCTDERIASHVDFDVMNNAPLHAIGVASSAFDRGIAIEEDLVDSLIHDLTQGVGEWHVVTRAHGLTVEEGCRIEVAGVEIGWLPGRPV
jgi:hypothetical protein